MDKKNNKYTFSQMYASLDIIFSERCKFAHGESSYEGTITELIDNFERTISWLYEIDDIINDKQLKG